MSADLRSLRLTRADGSSWVLTLRPPRDPGAPTLLVVPAMGLGARWYRPLLEQLQAAGVGAAVTELRGHEEGGQPAGRRRDHGYADLVADLDVATRTLEERLGHPPYLLGHSLGGQVACGLLAQRPAAAAGLALVASGTPYWRAWRSPRLLLLTQGAAALAAVVGHFPGARFGFAGREAPTQTRDWARLARTGRLRFPGLDGEVADHSAALAGLRLPVLALTLAGDHLAPPRSTDAMLAWLPAADVERHHVDPAAQAPGGDGVDGGMPATDHLRWARTPQVVLPTLLSWLERVHVRPPGPAHRAPRPASGRALEEP